MEKVIHIGVDPGKTGFITVFKEGEFYFFPMPKHKVPTGEFTKTGKQKMKSEFHEFGMVLLMRELYKFCKGYKIFSCVEQVTGRNGWAAERNFEFGGMAKVQKFIMMSIGAEVEMVRPQKWQSFLYQDYDMIKIPSSTGKTMVNDTKAMSAMVAKKEYPHINFSTNGKTETVNHNKTDSFLMCVYSIRRNS